ncbi:MAG: hypothetical protein Q9195_004151 [Heterodermia aff. obscurata]
MPPHNRVNPSIQQGNRPLTELEEARESYRRTMGNSILPTPSVSGFNAKPKPQLRRQGELGLTPMGLVLEGRQPGCVLNRDLSPDTLSHILVEDNLKWLGIGNGRGRKRALAKIKYLDEGEDVGDSGVMELQATGDEEEESELKSAKNENGTAEDTKPDIIKDECNHDKGSGP